MGAAAHGAFSLADPDTTREILNAAGFAQVRVDAVTAPMRMGSSVEDTVGFMRTTEFAATLFADASPDQATAGWQAVADALASHAGPDGVELHGATWLVTAKVP